MQIFIRLFFLYLILCLNFVYAQTVIKVSGDEALISVSEQNRFEVGSRLQLLNAKLDKMGEAKIVKISDNKRTALCKVTSGRVEIGYVAELAEKPESEPPEKVRQEIYLSERDREILAIGEISTTRYIIGGIVGTYPIGLGVGHAIQGRYTDIGWVFTVGELTSLTVAFIGAMSCFGDSWDGDDDCNNTLLGLGVGAFVGFRIWEAIDVWAVPPGHNRRYRELRRLVGKSNDSTPSLRLSLLPRTDGASIGLSYRF